MGEELHSLKDKGILFKSFKAKLSLECFLLKSLKAKLSHLLSYKCWHCTAASKGDVILAILG